jgi:hypothetical protein
MATSIRTLLCCASHATHYAKLAMILPIHHAIAAYQPQPYLKGHMIAIAIRATSIKTQFRYASTATHYAKHVSAQLILPAKLVHLHRE